MGTAQTKVSILGVEYTIRGDAATDRIQEVGRFVDDKMRQAKSRTDLSQDNAQVAILTSLNIAYELFNDRASSQEELARIRRRATELADRLEQCLSGGRSHPSPEGIADPQGRTW